MAPHPAIAYVPADAEPESARAGLQLVATVDREGPEGLASALAWIEEGRADTLLLARLGDGCGSLHELRALLRWLHERGAGLVALDVGLDSRADACTRLDSLLAALEHLQHAPPPGRPRPGRPGIAAVAPELQARIAGLRADGLSLRAIAEALDRDGVPTPRGGARWRPSSVQAALGYRRPRPPHPGIPVAPPRAAPPGRVAPPPAAREHRGGPPAGGPRPPGGHR